MEIKVGENVRTKSGDIGIFNKYFEDKAWFEMKKNDDDFYGIQVSAIVKHSFNIIDLIEVGDIIEINNEKYEVIFDKSMDKLGVLIPNRDYLEIRHSALEHIFNEYKDIRIITKEQYERDCYTVEEEE